MSRPSDFRQYDDDIPPFLSGEPVRTHREVASLLGIGRARVYFHETSALDRMRKAFERFGGTNGAFDDISPKQFQEILNFLRVRRPNEASRDDPKSQRFAAQHGWRTVESIVSLNDGMTDRAEVCEAYNLLKADHDSVVRPPVFVPSEDGHANLYSIEAMAFAEDRLFIRCWPRKNGVSRSVAALSDLSCLVIVESERGEDAEGAFDVPITLCAVLSERRHAKARKP